MRNNRKRTRAADRKRRLDMIGAAMIGAVALGFGGLLMGAAELDRRNGITVSESLERNGIHGAAAIARAYERPRPFVAKLESAIGEAPAVEARLIGRCGGRMMAAMEESSFPSGCDWIEPIRADDGRPGA